MTTREQVKQAKRLGRFYMRRADRARADRFMPQARELRAKALAFYSDASAMIAAHNAGASA